MIRLIFLKELRAHIYSLRFSLALILGLAAFVTVGVTFLQTMRDQQEYRQVVRTDMQERFENSKESLRNLCNMIFTVYPQLKPELLINAGNLKDLPAGYYFRLYRIYQVIGEAYDVQDNNLVPRSKDLDWTFVVGIILSFLALILLYDSISGEKEGRTLALALSTPLSRLELFWGKYLAGMAVCFLVLLAGLLLSTLTVLVFGNISLTWNWLATAGISAVAFLMYLSIFVLIGLIGSSLFTRSSVSMVFLLFIWVLLVWILPGMGGVFGEWIQPVKSGREFNNEFWESFEEVYTGEKVSKALSEKDLDFDRRLAELEALGIKKRENWWDSFIEQVKTGRKATMASPFSALQALTEMISGTGFYHLRHSYAQIFSYQRRLSEFITEKDARDTDSPHFRSVTLRSHLLSDKPFDPGEVPRFQDRPISLNQSLTDSLPYWSLLVIFNLFLVILGYWLLYRYDTRAQ